MYQWKVDRRIAPVGGSEGKGAWNLDKPRAQTFLLNSTVFILPAKTGQTSIRGALNKALDVMGSSERPTHLTYDQLRQYQGPVIMTIRHPAARLISAFNNKFSHQYKFEDFFKEVLKIPDIYSDIHVQSMSFLIGDVLPNYVIRVERMREDYSIVRKNSCPWLPKVHSLPHANATGTGSKWKDILTPDERQALYLRYKRDYELFDYEV